jgi:hypothetical protein
MSIVLIFHSIFIKKQLELTGFGAIFIALELISKLSRQIFDF